MILTTSINKGFIMELTLELLKSRKKKKMANVNALSQEFIKLWESHDHFVFYCKDPNYFTFITIEELDVLMNRHGWVMGIEDVERDENGSINHYEGHYWFKEDEPRVRSELSYSMVFSAINDFFENHKALFFIP